MELLTILRRRSSLWIFGYGSLVWRPDFMYKNKKVGCINGYKRRFWQGDYFYRGNKDKPGRVVTLVEDSKACTWGVAYEVTGSQIEASLQYLNVREIKTGGYIAEMVEFVPHDCCQKPFPALVYIATPDNPAYLGPALEKEIAAQIAVCGGCAGLNVEYLLRLVEFMRVCCPKAKDNHLFSIEAAAFNILQDCKTPSGNFVKECLTCCPSFSQNFPIK